MICVGLWRWVDLYAGSVEGVGEWMDWGQVYSYYEVERRQRSAHWKRRVQTEFEAVISAVKLSSEARLWLQHYTAASSLEESPDEHAEVQKRLQLYDDGLRVQAVLDVRESGRWTNGVAELEYIIQWEGWDEAIPEEAFSLETQSGLLPPIRAGGRDTMAEGERARVTRLLSEARSRDVQGSLPAIMPFHLQTALVSHFGSIGWNTLRSGKIESKTKEMKDVVRIMEEMAIRAARPYELPSSLRPAQLQNAALEWAPDPRQQFFGGVVPTVVSALSRQEAPGQGNSDAIDDEARSIIIAANDESDTPAVESGVVSAAQRAEDFLQSLGQDEDVFSEGAQTGWTSDNPPPNQRTGRYTREARYARGSALLGTIRS